MKDTNAITQAQRVSENTEARSPISEHGKFATARSRVKTALLALTIGAASPAMSEETDNNTQVADASGAVIATLEDSASGDAQGGSIDNNLNSLSISEINQRIAEIDEEILEIENLPDITTDDRRAKRALQKEKDALQVRLVELENQQQAENQAIIEAENQKQAWHNKNQSQQEATIEEENSIQEANR